MTGSRVLHVLSALDSGGAEMRTLEVQEVLRGQDIVFDYLLLSGREGRLAHRATAMGSRLYSVPLDLSFPGSFYRLLRGEEHRVVHSHVATFSGAILQVARWSGVPGRVAHFRSDGDSHGHGAKRRLQREAMRRLIERNATDILGVSPGSLTQGYRVGWRGDPRARVVPNGVPRGPRRGAERRPGPLSLVNIGRPLVTKRRAFLGHVVRELSARDVPASLTCIGPTGADTNELQAMAKAQGWSDRLHLLGTRDDARALLVEADLALFPSTLEGLPGSVLESLSAGLPVFATDIPGTRFVADNVRGCTLLSRSADETAWATAIMDSRANPLGPEDIAGSLDASCFSLDSVARTLMEIYDRHL